VLPVQRAASEAQTGEKLMQDEQQHVSAGQRLALPEIVTFPAEVDFTNSDLVGAGLLAVFRPGVSLVIADLSRTAFCDAAAIRCLLLANNHAVCTGSQLRVVVSENAVRRALDVSGAVQSLDVYPDLQAALSRGSGIRAVSELSEARSSRLFEMPASRLFVLLAGESASGSHRELAPLAELEDRQKVLPARG
jgi:anti-anti-sigma factor